MIKYEFLKVTPTYTGGGIYVIDGAIKNGLYFMACPSDGFTEILDADGSEKDNNGDQVMYDSEWIELHRVNTLVDGTDNDSFMCELCEWIINNRPNGNYAFSDIKKIYSDYLDSKNAEKYANLEYDEIDIGGPIDALMDWWMDKAMTDKQYNRDEDEVPCNASGVCVALGKIAARALSGCEEDISFFVSIEVYDGEIYWRVTDTPKISSDTEELYKIEIMNGDPYLYKVFIKKTKIEEHYCGTSDITYLMEVNWSYGDVASMEVIGFYSGEPTEELTKYYSHHRGVRVDYAL